MDDRGLGRTRAKAGALLAALTLLAGGCSSADDKNDGAAPSSTQNSPSASAASSAPESAAATSADSSPASAAATTAAPAGKPVTLEIWDWSSPPPEAMEALDKDYMAAHPEVTIKRVHQPFDSFPTLIRSAIAARKGPDIFETYASPFLFDYVQGIQPIQDLVTPEDRKNLLGWNLVSSGLKADGQAHGVPWTGQGINFYYNKALFKKAGLDPEAPPKTWAEFLAACEALKKAQIVPIVSGFKDGYYGEWWGDVFSAQFMTDAELEASYSKPDWTSQAMQKGLGHMVELYNKGYMTPKAEAVPLFPDAVNAFGAGKGAMFLGLSANSVNWSQFADLPVGKDLGAFLPPVLPGSLYSEPRFDFGPGLAWVVTKWSKNAQAAYDYLSFISSAKQQEKIFQLSGSIPNHAEAKPTHENPVAKEILAWVTEKPTYIGQVTTIRAPVQATYDKVMPEIITGSVSIEEGLKQIQATQDKTPPIPE